MYTVSVNSNEGELLKLKTIKVTPKIDNEAPILDMMTATAEHIKIKISASGSDSKSGIKQFNYTISPATVVPQESGAFRDGETIEIIATEEIEYTITLTAEDNAGNKSEAQIKKVTPSKLLTIAQAKENVNAETLRYYIGAHVTDYNPPAGGKYRIYYYDEIGEFGSANTIYLKRETGPYVALNTNSVTQEGIEMMKKMNPMWARSSYTEINNANEKATVWLCDPANWSNYKTNDSSFAIGSTGIEMYAKAYNIWKENNSTGSGVVVNSVNANGYSVSSNVEKGPYDIFRPSGNVWLMFASPWYNLPGDMPAINATSITGFSVNTKCSVFPIVPLDN